MHKLDMQHYSNLNFLNGVLYNAAGVATFSVHAALAQMTSAISPSSRFSYYLIFLHSKNAGIFSAVCVCMVHRWRNHRESFKSGVSRCIQTVFHHPCSLLNLHLYLNASTPNIVVILAEVRHHNHIVFFSSYLYFFQLSSVIICTI